MGIIHSCCLYWQTPKMLIFFGKVHTSVPYSQEAWLSLEERKRDPILKWIDVTYFLYNLNSRQNSALHTDPKEIAGSEALPRFWEQVSRMPDSQKPVSHPVHYYPLGCHGSLSIPLAHWIKSSLVGIVKKCLRHLWTVYTKKDLNDLDNTMMWSLT